jgi:hypothetical protein
MENLGTRIQLAGLCVPGMVMLMNAATGYEFGRLGHVVVVMVAVAVIAVGRIVAQLDVAVEAD